MQQLILPVHYSKYPNTFSTNNANQQVLIKGYKTFWSNNSTVSVYYNDLNKTARIVINQLVTNPKTTWVQYGNSNFLSDIAPSMPVLFFTSDSTVMLYIDDSGRLYLKSNTGAALTNKNLYCQHDWSY